MSKIKKISVIVLIFSLIAAVTFVIPKRSHQTEPSPKDFDSFTFSLFQEELRSNTLNLHYTVNNPGDFGILDYPITLGDYTPNIQEQKKSLSQLITQLNEFNPTTFSKKQQITYSLLMDYFENEQKLTDYSLYSQPLGPSLGVQAQLPVLLAEYTFHSQQDIEDYLGLLQQIPIYFESIMALEREQAKAGLFLCENTLNAVQQQCQTFAASIDSNILIENFPNQLAQLPASSQNNTSNQEYIAKQKEIVKKLVCPAYTALSNSLEELRPYCTKYEGLSSLPNGKNYYQLLVKTSVGTDKSIEDIRKTINNKLTDVQKDTAKIILDGNNGDKNILEQLDSVSIFPEKPEEILTVLQQRMRQDFPPVPSSHFQVKKVSPALSEYLSPAFYLTPPIDNLNQNTIYINEAKVTDSLSLFSTLAHEGYPGHLYQSTYYSNTNPNPVRYLLSYPGYTEGWATYVELYSYSICGLDNNIASLLKNNTIFTLGLYCLADIGIHNDGWNLSQTASFFGDYGISDLSAITQIYDIIVSEPANYLRYFLGYLEFEECYQIYTKAFGDKGSLKDFHARVLNIGPCPFYLLRQWLLE